MLCPRCYQIIPSESLRWATAAQEAIERVAALAEDYRTMTVLDDEDRRRNVRAAERIEACLAGYKLKAYR